MTASVRSSSRVDTGTLGWVKTEIDQTLEEARDALRQYTQANDDVTPLRSFANSIHQIAGTLQMVELDGASQLAQEIESLASAVVAGKAGGADPATLLDEGLNHLSRYMTRLAEGAPDRPVDNVEFINELRRARQADVLDGYAVFRPDLQVFPTREQAAEELGEDEYLQRVRELRQRYQGALLRWLRDHGDEAAWQEMAEVITALYRMSRFQTAMQVWWVARAYLDVLNQAELDSDDPRKHPLAKLDILMRTLAEENEAAIARQGSEKLVRYMLYQIGTSDTRTEAVMEVVQLFELDNLLGSQAAAPLPEASVLAAMRERVAEPLAAVRDALDECAGTGIAGEAFLAADQHLQDIAEVAQELGIDELAQVSAAIRRLLFSGEAPNHSEEVLVVAARALLFIEHTLETSEHVAADWRQEAAMVMDQLESGGQRSQEPSLAIESREIDTDSLDKPELRRLVAAVAGQVEDNLKSAEQNLENFARDASDTDSMSAVITSLQQVHGAVRMLGQHKLCELLETAVSRIQELISGEAFPSEPLLDALAVTIGTTEAYVRGLQHDAANLDVLLNRAVLELEAAASRGGPAPVDPAVTFKHIQDAFSAWMADNADYEAFHDLRRSLRDIGSMAQQQEQDKLRGIAEEMINLLDIVMDDPAALTDEVEGTLRRSLAALTERAGTVTLPSGSDEAAADAPAVKAEVSGIEEETDETEEVDDADDIIRETFAEEAQECLQNIDAYLHTLRQEPGDDLALADMRRGFHTIKGSGRMARASGIAELAWIVEDVLNQHLENNEEPSEQALQFVSRARDELGTLLQRGLDSDTDLSSWREQASSLSPGPASGEQEASAPAGPSEAPAANVETLSIVEDKGAPASGFREEEAGSADAGHAPPAEGETSVLHSIDDLGEQGHDLAGEPGTAEASPFSDDEVIRIFSREALSHMAAIRSVVDECRRQGQAAVSDELQRAVHTLRGNARSLHLVEMSEAYSALDQALSAKESGGTPLREPDAEMLDALLVATAKVLDHLNRDKRFPDVLRQELVEIAGSIEGDAGEPGDGGSVDSNPLEGLEFVSEFAGDAGAASTSPAPEETSPKPESDSLELDVVSDSGSAFDDLVDADRAPGEASGAETSKGPESEAGSEAPADESEAGSDAAVDESQDLESDAAVDESQSLRSDADSAASVDEGDAVGSDGEPVTPAVSAGAETADDVLGDADLKDVFMEEATDTLSRFESALEQARGGGLGEESTRTLKRELHTLKGSALAAGLQSIGDLSHDAETMLDDVSGRDEPPPDLLDILEEVHDTLANMVHSLDDDQPAAPDPGLVRRLRSASASAPAAATGQAIPSMIPEEGVTEPVAEPEKSATMSDPDDEPDPPPSGGATAQARGETPRPAGGRSTVRIHSNVLDKLVNYAGEVSISRAQLEEQLSGLKSNLNELRGNVARFADQVRELDIQADTQIRSRVSEEKVSEAGHDFDPLEMDRYSRLQQLSRSLSESVDDLVTIQTGLNRFAVQTEGVLSQQAMLNTELQDGLMSARMVPFNTLVPRLRHQARQTARELGKEIDFSVTGSELEVDRNILGQLSEALEHMIRNSLDHGIEAAAERERAGKPARGSVRIECRQEGNEFVLTFSDDGAGLDVERIKSRAVEAGLLSADSDLTDDEVIQLIVLSGFSTAPQVTQLSGRGVGLDVVNDAVRRLGGTLSMDNRPGEGASFELRLPLSLSITQAMFVRCGDQRFAIPLGVIETVMKTDPENLSELSKDGDPLFRHDDQLYTLMDLTATLGLEPASPSKRIPILLVRMGARDVAVRVDDLVGTDEIVVKQLGDHLGRLSGINGATVTGDGSVVLILDLAELWVAQERLPAFKHEPVREADAPPKVMVVDDSLTVRKVTGRNLGRHGIEVTMARDGLDALDQLAESRPDVMLVDIEMPRMDGYELTTRIREDANFRDIPIIVITSRAGTRHRDKAMELGANAYLTKPYQERELLDQVNAFLNRAPETTVH